MKPAIQNPGGDNPKGITVSAPCRVDLGGTLDLSTFYFSLMHQGPCTFNMALDLRTRVTVRPYEKGAVKISSAGFESAVFASESLPFKHPLGLMFAVADYFKADSVHIEIDSASPVRSALGGSSVAAVALTGALSRLYRPSPLYPVTRKEIALLSHRLEMVSAQVPCGIQDHLAAAYGGVNIWFWEPGIRGKDFTRKSVIRKRDYARLEKCILLAYCGNPHESLDVNGRWVKQFMDGRFRKEWAEIIKITRDFAEALSKADLKTAGDQMNRETRLRLQMTPDVLDETGKKLFAAAQSGNCGARFTGAGGGGCVWGLGSESDIRELKIQWEKILSEQEQACLLPVVLDAEGLKVH